MALFFNPFNSPSIFWCVQRERNQKWDVGDKKDDWWWQYCWKWHCWVLMTQSYNVECGWQLKECWWWKMVQSQCLLRLVIYIKLVYSLYGWWHMVIWMIADNNNYYTSDNTNISPNRSWSVDTDHWGDIGDDKWWHIYMWCMMTILTSPPTGVEVLTMTIDQGK